MSAQGRKPKTKRVVIFFHLNNTAFNRCKAEYSIFIKCSEYLSIRLNVKCDLLQCKKKKNKEIDRQC